MPDAAGWAGACLAVVAALPGAGLVASIREAGLVAVLPEAIPVVASPGAVAVCRMGAVVLGESCPYHLPPGMASFRIWRPAPEGQAVPPPRLRRRACRGLRLEEEVTEGRRATGHELVDEHRAKSHDRNWRSRRSGQVSPHWGRMPLLRLGSGRHIANWKESYFS